MLNPTERAALLRFARDTIAAHLKGSRAAPASPARGSARSFRRVRHAARRAASCADASGIPAPNDPLDEVVGRCAIAAATEDPRFPPLSADELSGLELEISVLTPIRTVDDLTEIEVGRDGLVAQDGFRRGLLLPQVATEHGWDRETFLSHTCLKAGLRPDAWRTGAKISRFQAEVFSEQSELAQRNRS